jgi:hypothetical protein
MSTYLERSTLRREEAEARPARAPRHRREDRAGRSILVLAWAELWKRTVGGSFERLPDPARHPECWFKFL